MRDEYLQLHSTNILTHQMRQAQISFFCSDGGRDCLSFSALSLSAMVRVYRKRLQRILNLVTEPFFLIFTFLASFLRAIWRNCLISVICFGILVAVVAAIKHTALCGSPA